MEGTHKVAVVGIHLGTHFGKVIVTPYYLGVGNWWVVVVETVVAAYPDSFFRLHVHIY